MALNLQPKQQIKSSLNLKLWTKILQTNNQELDELLHLISSENPFIELKDSSYLFENNYSFTNGINENTLFETKSLYEKLYEQIIEPLFSTTLEQKIAYEIIENINDLGYFEGDINEIATKYNIEEYIIEQIRQKFKYLEPIGVGSLNFKESFLFQLENFEIKKELFDITKIIINDLENFNKYVNNNYFKDAMSLIQKFTNPPSLEFLDSNPTIIPDFKIDLKDGINIYFNDIYLNDILISNTFKTNDLKIRENIKKARELIDLLDLRKQTLQKIILLIVEYQMDFFQGKSLKPLIMQKIAEELSFSQSTISRAISGKYLECERGVYPLKYFFSAQIGNEKICSEEIKKYLDLTIKNENKQNPLSDEKLLLIINSNFNTNISRRSITKYRLSLQILSSRERKIMYKIKKH